MISDPDGLARRAPGIRFETRPPAPASVLPRMDIAAFVGFAASGPLDLPVPVEDLPRFRDLFGDDPVLAWDPERQVYQRALLGPSVAAFFRNGGRRCWVVRVAGAGAATARLRLPGLVCAEQRRPALLAARSPGTWAERLRVSATLAREPLQTAPGAAPSAGLLGDGGGAIELAEQARVGVGDLLEVQWPVAGLALWAFAEPPTTGAVGLRIALTGRVWFSLGGGAAHGDSPGPEVGERLETTEAQALYALGGTPGPAAVSRLTLDLRVRAGDDPDGDPDDDRNLAECRQGTCTAAAAGNRRLSRLAFDPRHPRFFGALPDDLTLLRLLPGRADPPLRPERMRLLDDVANPARFPLAGVAGQTRPYLPLGLPITDLAGGAATDDHWVRPEPPGLAEPAARDGLDIFDPALFADPGLTGLGLATLIPEAERRYYLEGRPLRGLHALLPVSEVTLVALPDLIHRPWGRALPPSAPSLNAPILFGRVEDTADGERARLDWTPVAGGTAYETQQAAASATEAWRTIARIEATGTLADLAPGCVGGDRFRVRALAGGAPGPWSNTLALRRHPGRFRVCGEAAPIPLVLWLAASGSPDQGPVLAWGHLEGGPPPADSRVEIQAADGPLFSVPAPLSFEPASPPIDELAVPVPQDLPRYYRVRAGADQPWSNTVVVQPAARSAYTLEAADAADPADLVAVQQALLRFCAGRGDLFAVLSLPRGQRLEAAARHLAALTALDTAGSEERMRALSFGALYHPWVLGTEGAADLGLLALPPDGLVLGTMAAQAAAEGAWTPPANLLLRGPLALEPALDTNAEHTLAALRINPIAQRPRGFLAWGVSTLSATGEVTDVQVRRLLILLRRLALREGNLYVFEPNDGTLRGRVRLIFERLLGQLYRAGALGGATPEEAFRVVVDTGAAAVQAQEQGQLIVELRVLPALAVERIRVRLIQDGPERLTVEAP